MKPNRKPQDFPTKEQIEAAIDAYAPYTELAEAYKVGLFALKFTAKMMGEPSEDMQGLIHEMFGAEEGSELCSVVKGLIVSQAIKEVLDEA